MPPNRKTNADVVDGLATLSVNELVNPKFLPLTTSQEEEEVKEEKQQERHDDKIAAAPTTSSLDTTVVLKAPHTADASHPAHMYWDWPSHETSKQQMIDAILKEEHARQLLSASHIQ